MRLRLTREAEADLDAAYAWYREQSYGLGDAFLRSVDACLASIDREPEAYQLIDRTMQRALLRRFPYGVFFEVAATEIIVYGAFHCARDPEVWRRRRDA
ncbi:MAG: type II toxin-antitoxin system RelE/ParE family toxin [Candidatus Rokubacteria bacterium]|nr:type II toxin-antitoxin system RelE/ParE family toxin [Candidatus Rokubacteria bacterium]MBI3106816.1 type II toxin-antitoxin system RelE/ParE family toxin [Candidatus Rokubacteria bacterium]